MKYMDGWMVRRMDGFMVRRMDGCMDDEKTPEKVKKRDNKKR